MTRRRLAFHSLWVATLVAGALAPPRGVDAAPVLLASEEIRVESGSSVVTGILRRPVEGSRLPGIVLLQSDGPLHSGAAQTWSDSLATRGYAVLSIAVVGLDDDAARVETGLWQTLGADAAAAAKALRAHESVGNTVGVLASGRATWALPHAAALDSTLAFAVALAGGPLGLAEQELYRRKQNLVADRYEPANVERGGSIVWVYFLYLKSGGTERIESVRREYERYRLEPWFHLLELPTEDPTSTKWPPERTQFALALNYNPLPVFATMQLPLLAVLGADDRVWPAMATAGAYESLKKPNVTVRTLEGADHEFRRRDEASGGSQAAEVFGIIDAWIRSVAAPSP